MQAFCTSLLVASEFLLKFLYVMVDFEGFVLATELDKGSFPPYYEVNSKNDLKGIYSKTRMVSSAREPIYMRLNITLYLRKGDTGHWLISEDPLGKVVRVRQNSSLFKRLGKNKIPS